MRAATRDELLLLRQALDLFERLGYSIPGSRARSQGLVPLMFDRDALAIGTMVESEHTSSPGVALEIAMVHLAEHPAYYAALERMEQKLRERRTR